MNIKISFSDLYLSSILQLTREYFVYHAEQTLRWKKKSICAEKGVGVNVSVPYIDEMSI